MKSIAELFWGLVFIGLIGWLFVLVGAGVVLGIGGLVDPVIGGVIGIFGFLIGVCSSSDVLAGWFMRLNEECPVIPRTLIFSFLVVVLVTLNILLQEWLFSEEVRAFLRGK